MDMGLQETIGSLRQFLSDLSDDLEKASRGNRSAAQRVRTGSIEFAKTAKLFRKESVQEEKKEGKKMALKVRKK
jgi:hypothetical protein